MGIIETIQKRSGLASAFLGVFIFAILLSNGFVSVEYLFSKKEHTYILSIEGHDIQEHEYKRRFATYMQQITAQYGNHPEGKQLAHDQTYDSYLLQYILQPKAKAVGLLVSSEEVNENLALTIEKYAEYMATNKETLAVDPVLRGNYIIRLNEQKEWLNMMGKEEALKKYREKITALLDLSDIMPNHYLGMTYAEVLPALDKQQVGPTFRLTYVNASIMPEGKEVTEEQQRAYYAKHSKKYAELPTQQIELIALPITFTTRDKEKAKHDITGLKEGFAKTLQPKAYTTRYTESKEAVVVYTKATLPPLLKKMLQQGKKQQVIGPFVTEDETYALYRLLPKQKGAKPGEFHFAMLTRKIESSEESAAAVMQRAKGYCTRIKDKASWEELIKEEKLQPFTIHVGPLELKRNLGKKEAALVIRRKAAAGIVKKALSAPFQHGDQVFIAYVLPQKKKGARDENFQKHKDSISLELKKMRICQEIAGLGPKVTYNVLLNGIEGLDTSHVKQYKRVPLHKLVAEKDYSFATPELIGAAHALQVHEQASPIITPHGIVIIERLANKKERSLPPAKSFSEHMKEEEKRQKEKTATNLRRLLYDNEDLHIDDMRYISA